MGIERGERLHCRQGRERVVGDRIGAHARMHLRIGVLDPERTDEIARVAAPVRPFDRHAGRQVLAEPEARAREIAEELRHRGQGNVRRGPHPQAAERRPVAPVAALRADEQGRGKAPRLGQEPERLAAEAVADDELGPLAEEAPCRGGVEHAPVAHSCRGGTQVPIARATDAAIVEREHAVAALGEIARVLGVVGLRHAGCRHDEHRMLAAAVDRGTERGAVVRRERYLHEFHKSDAPPITISVSRNSTCRCACMRLTSHAASALPGIVATPMTMPVIAVCWSRRAKRWKSAALHRSSATLMSASVASTAWPAMPVPRSSDTLMTPTPLATPLARPNTVEPIASPVRPSAILRRLSARRSGTEAMTTTPSTVPIARASSSL